MRIDDIPGCIAWRIVGICRLSPGATVIIRDAGTGEELRSFLLLTKGLNRLKADTRSVYETRSDSRSA